MIIGVDIDGVLANFNDAYIDLCIKLTGKDLFHPKPFEITTWHYPEAQGYTKTEIKTVWKHIAESRDFWHKLKPYPGVAGFLKYLSNLNNSDNDIYFITSRVGRTSQWQTMMWLSEFYVEPMVLISSEKGECCHALGIEYYIDDKIENCVDVTLTNTKCYMLARPWNVQVPGIPRLNSLIEFMEVLKNVNTKQESV